ncbi:hypothetical protein Ahy_A05g025248 [Arachis hypogaea]|uniref:Uncharacterized protein n=1 Tax=Arachis hypogaea TaxID=3818 RepID=A0A445D7X7_ARAHY|nr:hypothetical protein Ahy_A05g025248 [Arachis hypogaea]
MKFPNSINSFVWTTWTETALQDGGERLIEWRESIDRDLANLRFTIREGSGQHGATRFAEWHTDEFELLLIKMFVEIEYAGDRMSGKTVPVEEAKAMDLSAVDADIDVKVSVRIVDRIGSFGAIEFLALTAKDNLTTEFIKLQVAYDYYNEYGRIKGFSVRRSKVGRRT